MDQAFALLQQQAQQVAILLQNQAAAEEQRQVLQGQIAALTQAGIAAVQQQARASVGVKPLALPKFSAKVGPNEASFAPWLT